MRFLLFFALFFVNLFGEVISPDKAFKIYPKVSQNSVIFSFDIDKSVYLYEKKLKFEILESKEDITKFANLPNSQIYKNYQIFSDNFSVQIPLELILLSANSQNFRINIYFEACSFDGFCYEPQTQIYEFDKNGEKYDISLLQKDSLTNFSQEEKIAQILINKNFIITLLIFFGYGILLSLTPCVYPLIPILSSIIIAKTKDRPSIKKSFFISLVYVFAMSFAYACIGACIAFFGANLQSFLQNKFVIIAFALIFVILALSMFGLFEIKMPEKLQNTISKKSGEKGGIFGVFIMGFFSVLIVSPCISAPLSGVLLYIADNGSMVRGMFALFMLGLGSGALLLVVGLGGGLPRPGVWMENVKKIFAFILLFMAVWIISRVIGENFSLLLYGILAIGFAIFFDFFGTKSKFKKSLLFLILLYGIALIIGFNIGSTNFIKPLENLAKPVSLQGKMSKKLEFKYVDDLDELNKFVNLANRPVMVDFWASWCENCKELENSTFKDKAVFERLQNFELIKVDLTNSTAKNAEISQRLNIFGPPVLLFFKDGKEIEYLRVTGFIDKTKMLEILDKI